MKLDRPNETMPRLDGPVEQRVGSDSSDLFVIERQILDHFRSSDAAKRKAVKAKSKIKKEQTQVAAAKKSEVIEAWKAGRLLLQVKEKMDEGFDEWRKSLSRDGFAPATSSRYLRLAKEIPDFETLEELLRDAPSLRRLYVKFGIIKDQNARTPTQKVVRRFEAVTAEAARLDSSLEKLEQDDFDRLLQRFHEISEFMARVCPGHCSVTVKINGDPARPEDADPGE